MPTTSPSPAKHPTTAWRADIGPELLHTFIKVGAIFCMAAWVLMYAESKKGGGMLGIREFMDEFQEKFGDFSGMIKLPFTILTISLVISAVIVWIIT